MRRGGVTGGIVYCELTVCCTSRGRAVSTAKVQGFGVGPLVAEVMGEESLPQHVTLRTKETSMYRN